MRGRHYWAQRRSAHGPSTLRYDSALSPSSSTAGRFAHNWCRIKERLRKQFAEIANGFEKRLHAISVELTSIEGPLEVRSTFDSERSP